MAVEIVGQHFGRIGRMLGIEDIGRDLRPVHPAALRLACIVEHAGGQLQFGVGELVGRGGGGEIRHRIVGGIEAFGGGILQAGDDALGAGGQLAGLGPQRRIFARAVEFLDRGALALAVESAQRLAAEHFAQFVGDRLIGRRERCSRPSPARRLAPWRLRAQALPASWSRYRSSASAGLTSSAGAVTISAGFGSGAVGGRARRCGLGSIGRRGRGVDLEIAGGRRRNVGRFGPRDCCIDRELGGAGPGPIALRQR